MRHEVIVGNIGRVTPERCSEAEAREAYEEYVDQSKSGYGRAAHESVTWLKNGEPFLEHQGEMHQEEPDN